MWKRSILGLLIVAVSTNCNSQRPKDGTYTYTVIWDEFQGKSTGSTVTVKIIGDSIYVINNGSLTGEKGEIIEAGIIMKHRKTGRWIIAHSPNDKNAEEVGTCGEGPTAVDFVHRRYYAC